MTEEKWQSIIDDIQAKYEIIEREKKPLLEGGTVESIIFLGPIGRIRLERTVKPRLLAEKTTYSKRIGGDVKVEKVYDTEDLVSYIKAWRWEGEDWVNLDPGFFSA